MLTEFVLVTMLWAGRQWTPVTAEVFPNQAACQRAVVERNTQYCVPLIKTVPQPADNQKPVEQKSKEKK